MKMLSPMQLFRRLRGSKSEDDTKKLSPVPLAGASRAFRGNSTLCNAYAPTSDSGNRCACCKRQYVPCSKQFQVFCSLDCKAAGYAAAVY
ncbi:hypothetical protein Ae201684P_012006 [Aphanomyces euteiches]|uniref:Uncharacterized protein n=1 Tax=Aphanomyces euteiches TaxID=100861 RepID=A0A6G0WJ96_9STRA|nr:hypothetical protein Ae201684_014546 [Aphanomyces euteiches]KAH9081032.1 hypothetical protein Ae201684P_012006 [Aphanomyces euteiches]